MAKDFKLVSQQKTRAMYLIAFSALVVLLCASCSSSSGPRPETSLQPESVTKTEVLDAELTPVAKDDGDEIQAELASLSTDISEINSQVTSLQSDVDEIKAHHGDVDGAESRAQEIVDGTSGLIDRVEELKSKAEALEDSDTVEKCETMLASMEELNSSVSELHSNLETAASDPSYRHHEGIDDISDSMDDTTEKASEAEQDASE